MNWWGQYERSLVWAGAYWAGSLIFRDGPLILQTLGALNLANVLYLLLTWLACHHLNSARLRGWATHPFPPLIEKHPWLDFGLLGGRTGLSFVLTASVFGFIAAALFLPAVERLPLTREQAILTKVLCLLTVVCGWLMAHLAYALHYAFLYYRRPEPGLEFPNDPAPDLMDFVYFAFTVGATFASSDVNVTSKELRRTVMKHTLFSFMFNTAILALALQFALG